METFVERSIYEIKDNNIKFDTNGLLVHGGKEWLFPEGSEGLMNIDAFLEKAPAILVAEAGMGKTTFVEMMNQNNIYTILLRDFKNNDNYFDKKLIEGKKSGKIIIFDGLDEAVELANIIKSFVEENKSVKAIITTRYIKEVNDFGFKIYTLAPFSEKDVIEFAKINNEDGKSFINELRKANLIYFCSTPNGCEIALTSYRDGFGGKTQYDLWYTHIKQLASETSDSKINGDYTPGDIISCSEWIATAMLLSNKSTVCIGEKNCPPNAIDTSEIKDNFDLKLIHETLRRGIFKPKDAMCFEFVHSTYQDFLASIAFNKNINEKHWVKLLFDENTKLLIPQMEGTAIWLLNQNQAVYDMTLASPNKKIITLILENEPEKLLLSDFILKDENKLKVFQNIHENINRINFWNPLISSHIQKLGCEDVKKEIITLLGKKDTTIMELYLIRNIVIDNSYEDLVPYFVDIVLDKERTFEIRGFACSILTYFENNTDIKRLMPLLKDGDFSQDNKDEFKAYLLLCCYKSVSPDILLKNITEVKDTSYFGGYQLAISVVSKTLNEIITEETAQLFLDWAIKNHELDFRQSKRLEFSKSIITYCWKKHYDKIIDCLAEICSKKSYGFQDNFNIKSNYVESDDYNITIEELAGNPDKLIYVIIKILAKPDNNSSYNSILQEFGLNQNIDIIRTFFERIITDKIIINQNTAKYLQNFIHLGNIAELKDSINKLHEFSPELIKSYDDMISQREKERPEGERQEEYKRELEEMVAQGKKKEQCRYDSVMKIINGENPSPDSFCNVADYIFREYKPIYHSKFYGTLKSEEKDNLLKLATRYLTEFTIPKRERNSINICIGKALQLLLYADKERFNSLPKSFWENNAHEILKSSDFIDDKLKDVLDFFNETYPSIAEDAIINALNEELNEKLNEEDIYLTIFSIWGKRLSDPLARRVIEFIDDDKNNYRAFQKIKVLQVLYRVGKEKLVLDYLSKLLPKEFETKPDKDLADYLILAVGLDINTYLPRLLPILEKESDWRKDFICQTIGIPSSIQNPNIISNIDTVADFYILLEKDFPNKERQNNNECDSLFFINIYKGKIINYLNSGKEGSAKALEKIYKKYPEFTWVEPQIVSSKKREIAVQMNVLSMSQIKELYSKSEKELINSYQSLLSFIMEKLDDYKDHLEGKLNQVNSLWDIYRDKTDNNDKSEPKNEESLSDHVASFLDLTTKDIAICREVQVKRKLYNKGEKGSRTDIWIETYSPKKELMLKLCIEVKGNWNSEVETSFEQQLVDKYMKEDRADAGIFLVGYFGEKITKKTVNPICKTIESIESHLKSQKDKLILQNLIVDYKVIDCQLK